MGRHDHADRLRSVGMPRSGMPSYNASIPVGGSIDGRASGVGFNALADDFANAQPPNFSLNGKRCAVALP